MTDEEITQRKQQMEADADVAVAVLRIEYEARVDAVNKALIQNIKALLAANGKEFCSTCDGTGAIERMGSGCMRRWDGCPGCGGAGEQRGIGFLPASLGEKL